MDINYTFITAAEIEEVSTKMKMDYGKQYQ